MAENAIVNYLIMRREDGDSYHLVGGQDHKWIPFKDVPDGYGLGDFLDVEFDEKGNQKLLEGEKKRFPGVAAEDEYFPLVTLDMSYDAYYKTWRAYCHEFGNVYVPDYVDWPEKTDFDYCSETFFIKLLLDPGNTTNMGRVAWTIKQYVPPLPKPQPVPWKAEVVGDSPWIEEMDNPVHPGEFPGLVAGMIDDGHGSNTAFVFTLTAGQGLSDPRIARVAGIEVGDWIAFEAPFPIPDKFLVRKYRKIAPLVPARSIRNSVKVKLDRIDVTEEILDQGFFSQKHLGRVCNDRDVLMAGRGLTVIAERFKPTADDQPQWVVTQVIIPPIMTCRPGTETTQLFCYSADLGTTAFAVNKELLATHCKYLKNKFATNTTEGAKYDVVGHPKAIKRVLEILHFCDLRDTEFLEHDTPYLVFWTEMYEFLTIVLTWKIPELSIFIANKMLSFHCNKNFCNRCIHRALFASFEKLPYPRMANVNKITVRSWEKKYQTEFLQQFPNKKYSIRNFLNDYK